MKKRFDILFSSPIGESTFSTVLEAQKTIEEQNRVFVPYRGIYFLYIDSFVVWYDENIVFVPYRGIYFLYNWKKYTRATNGSFRPLSGNLLSLPVVQDICEWLEDSFRPLSGNLLSLQIFEIFMQNT